ncbi:mechanosensitive ion channel protein MscS [Patiriisocius marinistellae]|uniref:Mechanosensitive ion channel protein MscS n=1 Tax=Patiriisocius marinistellae TaxID=2494560 RepID=A0A5J4FYT0_9FLAO|nr:mechanosensitive ion channel domain-containing protein [Patiriisocius marinistellae]GEQ86352.1 mechanosensitive ion channel protein MscS [Patiriisocius marinistellae]
MITEAKLVEYSCILQEYMINTGANETFAIISNIIVNCIIIAFVVTILDIIIRKIIVQSFKTFSDKTKSTFDDYLVKSNFPRFIAHFAPIIILWHTLPVIFIEYPRIDTFFNIALQLYLVVLCILVFRSILRSLKSYAEGIEKYQDKPLQSYVQVMMIFAWGIGVFFAVNLLTGFDLGSVTALGALSAVILLIFKDTILGFVASIQVSVNDIVRIGDWITFSKFGADGYVTEINLATVRVQNFDNTFTTIPTYSLIADSFQNWRGMQESKGRRIKRSIFIKQNSIKFLTSNDLEELKKIQLIAPYISHREKEVSKFNATIAADKSIAINGRNQTNLGIFRNYAEAFITENELINPELFLMVRHLAPTDKGIPIEIFCFTYDKAWENYERIQANIFDHLIAAVPFFDLEVFESPTGSDFTNLSANNNENN